MIGAISFFVVFSLLIFVHELGHFVAAKLSGVRVDEFGFGYPPRLLKLGQWRETTISLNLLPIGGFVRMAEDDPSAPDSLASKRRLTRAFVYVAGSLMNVLLAVALFSINYMAGVMEPTGEPGTVVASVSAASPAEAAGIQPGDIIISVNGRSADQMQDAIEEIRSRLGQPVEIAIRRDGQLLPPLTAVPRLNPPRDQGALGVSLSPRLGKRQYPVWQAVPLGVRTTAAAVGAIYGGLRAVIRRQLPFQVSGPVGIYATTAEIANTNPTGLIPFTAFLSLNLVLLNLLPLPALDGGRLVFVLLEWVRRGRRVPAEKEALVHFLGMVVLLALMLVISVLDFNRYFG